MASLPSKPAPDDRFEREALAHGARIVCGIDEVGRGPLAGPVVAAAVVLGAEPIEGLTDSKAIGPAARERLFTLIVERSHVGIGTVSAASIDHVNIRQATFVAMRSALAALPVIPDHALIDGNASPSLAIKETLIVKGDARSVSIAAASIVAKVVRDRMMVAADNRWPIYGFAGHKGYPTPAHRTALKASGPCPIHRRTFGGVPADGPPPANVEGLLTPDHAVRN